MSLQFFQPPMCTPEALLFGQHTTVAPLDLISRSITITKSRFPAAPQVFARFPTEGSPTTLDKKKLRYATPGLPNEINIRAVKR
eukprot:7759340-Karenia_brevis.AAC.1